MPDPHPGGPQLPSAAGHRRDPQADRAPRSWQIDLRPFHRLREAHWQRHLERVAVATVNGMWLDPDFEEQVAGGTTPAPRHPLPPEAHPRAVGNTLRDRDADRLLAGVTLEPDISLAAVDGEPEGNLNPRGDIFTRFLNGLPPGARLPSPAAEQIAEAATSAAEEALEIDLPAAERRGTASPTDRSPATAPSAARPSAPRPDALEGAAVAVVHLALARVVERVEGRLHLLKLVLRGVVVRMEIGVVLPRQFTVGLADILGRCRPRHPERLVMIVSHQAPPPRVIVAGQPVRMRVLLGILRMWREALQGGGAGRRRDRVTSVRDA